MSSGIECQCCREMDTVKEQLSEEESDLCITTNEQFKIVCLNKDVLYTMLVTMKTMLYTFHCLTGETNIAYVPNLWSLSLMHNKTSLTIIHK